MKILVAEDDFLARKILFKALQAYGECDLACNGAEAWVAFRAAHQEGSSYDLILLDVMMPELEGTDVLHRIRDFEECMGLFHMDRARIVIATGSGEEACGREGWKDRTEGLILKPYTPLSVRSDLRRMGILTAAGKAGGA